MTRGEIQDAVIRCLENISMDDPTRIRNELKTFGDAEIPSVFFMEILGALEVELGIKRIPEKEVHKQVKSSLNSFCSLLEKIQGGN